MPIYDHLCEDCNELTEVVCRIVDRKELTICEHCGGSAKRIITAQIQRDEPTWLGSALRSLDDHDASRITNRTEYKRYLNSKGIVEAG